MAIRAVDIAFAVPDDESTMSGNDAGSRVVVVTGGAYGIGRGIVRLFIGRGERAVIADHHVERGRALELELAPAALFVHTDVTDENSICRMIEKTIAHWGRIDVLCNNAGIERYRRADEYTSQDWSDIIHTNLRGAFLCSKYALPHLRERHGSIIQISSIQAVANEPQISIYAGSKAGLLGLTRGMAIDFAPLGVRVNAICPGAIQTGMMEAAVADLADPRATLDALGKAIPLGRIGEPEDIARVVWFLASDDAAYVTGASIVVDGGVLARLAL